MDFKINFQLREIDKIIPWGDNHDYLSWFILTDGWLWINAGDGTVYEYSQAAREHWQCDDLKYNDYYLSRFLEDFCETFRFIREPVPKFLWDNIDKFEELALNWRNQHIDRMEMDELFDQFYDKEYTSLTEWFYDRIFDSGHLVGGPRIGCFRNEDRVKFYWESDYILDNGKSIWSFPKGIIELEYEEFVVETERFFDSFFMEMDKQVQLAVLKHWGKMRIDKSKNLLLRDNSVRKSGFKQELSLLSHKADTLTDWDKVEFLYGEMLKGLERYR